MISIMENTKDLEATSDMNESDIWASLKYGLKLQQKDKVFLNRLRKIITVDKDQSSKRRELIRKRNLSTDDIRMVVAEEWCVFISNSIFRVRPKVVKEFSKLLPNMEKYSSLKTKYEALITSRSEYDTKIIDEVNLREFDKPESFKKSRLNIKWQTFTGYDLKERPPVSFDTLLTSTFVCDTKR